MQKIKMRRSQYSMEFLIFFSILAILFFVWIIIYINLNEDAFKERDKKALDDLGKAIQNHIFAASNAHSGYYSNALIIPDRAGSVSYDIANSAYSFYLRSDDQDYIFNMPYTLGELKKGENTLWNVAGVVAVGDCPPVLKIDGDVDWANCSNGIDDDGDGLIDEEDGNCWSAPPDSEYRCDDDSEGEGGIYPYYVVCENADNEGLCEPLRDLWCPIIDCVANTPFCSAFPCT